MRRDFKEAVQLESIETVWMSVSLSEEFELRDWERAAMNRYLVNGYLALYAAGGRCEN